MKLKVKRALIVSAIVIVACLVVLLFPVHWPPPPAPCPQPSAIPPVLTHELILPPREGDAEAAFVPRVGCTHHEPLMGRHCHHFLYARGTMPWTRAELINSPIYLDEFLAHYASSDLLRDNVGGQRLSHLFAVWCIARRFRPRFVIESGKYRGLGLYNVRRALGPDAMLFSLDPNVIADTYVDDNANTHYFGGADPGNSRASFSPFTDIADVDWEAHGVDPAQTLVILDDHMSVPRRVDELYGAGFRRFYVDDNAPRPAGDSLCPKYLSDPRPPVAENNFRVPLYDAFGTLTGHATYPELLRLAHAFFARVRTYAEFPPLTLHPGFFAERAKDFRVSSAQEVWELTPEPLLTFRDERLRALDLGYGESNYYYCAYLELE